MTRPRVGSRTLTVWIALVALVVVLVVPAAPARAAAFVVTTAADAGPGSLREAIEAANAAAGPDQIVFDIPGPASTIVLASALPPVFDELDIDGTTDPDYAGVPVIGIEGSPGIDYGVGLFAPGSFLRGVAVHGFNRSGVLTGSSVTVESSWLGLRLDESVHPNEFFGVEVQGTDVIVGGPSSAQGNLISGNTFGNVGISVLGSGVRVENNWIGLTPDGTAAASSTTQLGILATGPHDVVVGPGNVVSGHVIGVQVSDDVTGMIIGNRIGTDATGTIAVPNQVGVNILNSGEVQVGGPLPDQGNVIRDSLSHGIVVEVDTGSATIQQNLVTGNGQQGIRLNGGPGGPVLVSGNQVFDNGALGIDIADDGVTPNDPDDGDNGQNGLQNFPVITQVDHDTTTTVHGTLDSTPGQDFVIEFFSSSACDPEGHGEGEHFLGSQTVTTDGNGDADFTSAAFSGPSVGDAITATATNVVDQATSEFSACVTVESTNGPPAADAGPDQVIESTHRFSAVHLDGTGSSDPDGDPLTYTWEGPFQGMSVLTGPTPHGRLPVGIHTITLTVDDGTTTDQDSLVVEVTPTVRIDTPVQDGLVAIGDQPSVAGYATGGAPVTLQLNDNPPVVVDPNRAAFFNADTLGSYIDGRNTITAESDGLTDTVTLTAVLDPSFFTCFGAQVTILGTGGSDVLTGTDGPDVIAALGGDDTILSLAGDDMICAGDGQDNVNAGVGDDLVSGGEGDDLIDGNGGADTLHGEDGEDTLLGGPGDDLLDGGADRDVIRGQGGRDTINGGDGEDTLYGNDGADRLNGDGGNDILYGGQNNDVLYGGDGDDELDGAGGNDTLRGEDGMDTLLGGDDDDRLIGGPHIDTCDGGAGSDMIARSCEL